MGKKIILLFILFSLILFNKYGYCNDADIATIDPEHEAASLSVTGLEDLGNNPITSICPEQTIYIIGSGFTSGALTVMNGGNTLTIVGTPTFSQIQVILPASVAGSFSVTAGMFNTTYSSFTVNTAPNSVLSLSSISPICPGTNGTINIQNSQAGINYQSYIGGTAVGTSYAGNGSFLPMSIPQGSLAVGNNTIDILASNGTCDIKLSIHPGITVNPKPGASNQNLNATQTTGCTGDNFGVINAGAFGAGDSFKWLSNTTGPTGVFNAIASSNTQNLLPGVLNQTTWFKRIITNSFGCFDTSTAVQLIVNSYPTGSAILGTSGASCTGQNITYTISGITPVSTVFSWSSTSGGSVISSTSNTAVIKFTNSGSNTIFVTATNGSCASAPLNFPVSINQTPDIIAASTASSVCSGSNINISLSSTGSMYWAATYSGGASSSPGSGSGSIADVANLPGTIDYLVTSTASSCSTSKHFVVIVNPKADTTLLFQRTKDTLCYNEDLVIKLPVSEPGVKYRFYKWNGVVTSLDSSSISTGGPVTITIPFSKFTPGIDTIRYVAVRPGCSTFINHKNLIIYTSPLSPLNPISTPNGTSLCSNAGTNVILKAPLYPVPSAVQYQWYDDDSKIINETTNSYTAFSESDYTVLSTDILSCEVFSPKITVGYGSLLPQVSASNTTTLSTQLSCSTSAVNYQWYANTPTGFKKIQGANTNSYTAYFDGDYMMGITTGNCFILSKGYSLSGKIGGSLLKLLSFSEDSSIILPSVDFHQNANVYPNPATKGETLTVNYIVGSELADISFTLYNAQGLEIFSKKLQSEGYITIDFNIPEIPSGLYQLLIYDGIRVTYKSININ